MANTCCSTAEVSQGGAVYSQMNAEITINGSSFTSNTASLTSGGAVYGGASSLDLGFVQRVIISDSSFAGNAAPSGVSVTHIASCAYV